MQKQKAKDKTRGSVEIQVFFVVREILIRLKYDYRNIRENEWGFMS
ncbi:hypothetical protein [Guptibacillus hwajinpoensis]